MRPPELEETYRNSPNLSAREGGYLLRFVPASVASAAKPLASTPMSVRVFLSCLGFCAVCFAPAVAAANDELQALLAVVEDIAEPAELSRFYAELIGQLSMRIAQANGGK